MEANSVSSVLESVTVHATGAVCTRIAQVSSKDGTFPSSVEIRGLPLLAEAGSLRARILGGPAALKVREVRSGYKVELADTVELSSEQKALDAAMEELSRLRSEAAIWDRRAERVVALKPIVPEREKGQLPPPTPVDALVSLARFADDELREIMRNRLELAERIKDAQNDVQLRRRRVQEASVSQRKGTTRVERTAIVSFAEGAPAGDATIAIEYVVGGARWVPAYELSLERAMDKGTLRVRAHIAQRTGEDWTRVRLALSTARLDRRADLPELRALKIGRRQQSAPRSGWRDAPAGLDELFYGYDAAVSLLQPRAPEPLPPPMQPAPMPMKLKKSRSPEEPGSAGDFEGAPVMARAARAMALPPAPPAASAPARDMAFARKSAASGGGPPGAMAPRGGAERVNADLFSVADGESGMDEDEGGYDEAGEEVDPAARQIEPERSLLDYGGLVLPPFEGGHRGRLQKRTADAFFAATVSMQVNISAFLSVAQQEESSVFFLAPPAHTRPVREAAGAFDFRYEADHRVDVPSDGAWHMVSVTHADIALRPEYISVPSVDPSVFRTVRVENASPNALLEGPAEVLLGGGYLMTVPFPTIPPRGTATVGLGVEEAIKVARNTTFDESAGGLLGGAAVLSHGVTIEVANRLQAPVHLEVRERLPVTNEKDVKVEEVEVKPAWAKDFEVREGVVVEGARVWKVELGAGGVQRLVARFDIRIPASKRIVGGNRRS